MSHDVKSKLGISLFIMIRINYSVKSTRIKDSRIIYSVIYIYRYRNIPNYQSRCCRFGTLFCNNQHKNRQQFLSQNVTTSQHFLFLRRPMPHISNKNQNSKLTEHSECLIFDGL